jgi:hypothetical protein
VAVGGAGDVFIADSNNSQVVGMQRSQPPSLSFTSTNIGSTSTDSRADSDRNGERDFDASDHHVLQECPTSEVYLGSFTVAASVSSGLTVAFTSSGSCTNSGTTYTMNSGTGTCSVIANQAGNGNYSAAPAVTQTVTATLARQTVTFTAKAPASSVYNSTFRWRPAPVRCCQQLSRRLVHAPTRGQPTP